MSAKAGCAVRLPRIVPDLVDSQGGHCDFANYGTPDDDAAGRCTRAPGSFFGVPLIVWTSSTGRKARMTQLSARVAPIPTDRCALASAVVLEPEFTSLIGPSSPQAGSCDRERGR